MHNERKYTLSEVLITAVTVSTHPPLLSLPHWRIFITMFAGLEPWPLQRNLYINKAVDPTSLTSGIVTVYWIQLQYSIKWLTKVVTLQSTQTLASIVGTVVRQWGYVNKLSQSNFWSACKAQASSCRSSPITSCMQSATPTHLMFGPVKWKINMLLLNTETSKCNVAVMYCRERLQDIYKNAKKCIFLPNSLRQY